MTFNELRKSKDSLPSGSTQRIADELALKQTQYAIISEVSILKMAAVVASILKPSRWRFGYVK